MSLAQYQMPSAVAAGSGWSANPNMQAPNMSQASGASVGDLRIPVESAQSNDSRGERSGDVCLAFDLFANPDALIVAQWSEESCECSSVVHNSNQMVSFTKQGKDQLLTSNLTTTEIYLGGEVFVGSKATMHDCQLFPASDVRDTISVERSPFVDVDKSGKVQLAGLLSLVVAHAAHLHQSTLPKVETNGKVKKGKGGKKSRRKQQSVTLISPVAFNQTQRAVLISAANQLDLDVRNVFNRAVATIAGSLYGTDRATGQNDTLISVLSTPGAAEKGSLVLYLSVAHLRGSASEVYEAALVRCEGAKGARQVGAKLGFERLCTVASSSGPLLLLPGAVPAASTAAEQLQNVVEKLCASAAAIKGEIAAVVLDGLLARGQSDRTQLRGVNAASLGLPSALHVHCADVADAAVGGSLLSAAELESSKQYLQLDSGEWRIAHLLPVADGVLEGTAVAVRVQWDQAQADAHAAQDFAAGEAGAGMAGVAAGALEDAAVVFAVGTRLWKEDSGRLPPRSPSQVAPTSFKQDFKWGGAVKVDGGRRSVTPAVGWPRVQILQRQTEGPRWLVLKTLTPLLNVAATEDLDQGQKDGGAEPVQSCSLEVRLDPATGSVNATQTKGSTLSTASSAFWGHAQLAFALVAPFVVLALVYYSGYFTEWYADWSATRQHTAWLLDFYQKNAPEKLADPDYVARTVAKYKGRMFLLWRGLERTYKVKWQPPHSILDSGASSAADEF